MKKVAIYISIWVLLWPPLATTAFIAVQLGLRDVLTRLTIQAPVTFAQAVDWYLAGFKLGIFPLMFLGTINWVLGSAVHWSVRVAVCCSIGFGITAFCGALLYVTAGIGSLAWWFGLVGAVPTAACIALTNHKQFRELGYWSEPPQPEA